MKKYCYYVSFYYRQGVDNGYGSTDYTADTKINTPEKIRELIVSIEEDGYFQGAVIISLIYLGVKFNKRLWCRRRKKVSDA